MCRHNGLIFLSLGLAAWGVTIGSTLTYLLAQQASGLFVPTRRSWWACLVDEPGRAEQTWGLKSLWVGSKMNSFSVPGWEGGLWKMCFTKWYPTTTDYFPCSGEYLELVLLRSGFTIDSCLITMPVPLSCKGYNSCVLQNASCMAGHNKQPIVILTMITIFQCLSSKALRVLCKH